MLSSRRPSLPSRPQRRTLCLAPIDLRRTAAPSAAMITSFFRPKDGVEASPAPAKAKPAADDAGASGEAEESPATNGATRKQRKVIADDDDVSSLKPGTVLEVNIKNFSGYKSAQQELPAPP